MDIFMGRFWSQLPTVIQEIAEADYVAIDLEMTGIEPRRQARLQQPTMDEVYQRAKCAAETFNMIQFGLTCLHYDEKQNSYAACSYNFYVSPMFKTDGDGANKQLSRMIDRTLVISYRTMLFLQSNRIRLEDSYIDGIPYLSRTEEAEIKSQFLMEEPDQERDLIDLQIQDAETQSFYDDIRSKIQLWENTPDDGDYVNIGNPHGGRLNRFQRRLVFQLLETEFPNKYFAAVKGDYFMQILKEADPKEEERRNAKLKEREAALKAQRGLRYLIEALAGGDFAHAVAGLVDTVSSADEQEVLSQLHKCEKKLKSRPPILVGHNMLFDLCFLYETFIGPMPGSLEGFRKEIHALFPRIVDTKHLVTQGKHDMTANDCLEELHTEALKQAHPAVVYQKPLEYNDPQKSHPHHAGFDSSMTATLYLKRAWAMLGGKGRAGGVPGPLPGWDDAFHQTYGNKIRVGNAGTLDFGVGLRAQPVATSISAGGAAEPLAAGALTGAVGTWVGSLAIVATANMMAEKMEKKKNENIEEEGRSGVGEVIPAARSTDDLKDLVKNTTDLLKSAASGGSLVDAVWQYGETVLTIAKAARDRMLDIGQTSAPEAKVVYMQSCIALKTVLDGLDLALKLPPGVSGSEETGGSNL